MTDFHAARAIAERILDEKVRLLAGEPVAIADDLTIQTDDVFVFFYNTVAYLETRSVSHALAGNGPIIVRRKGGLARIADSSRRAEQLGE